ncbi:MAG: phosphatase PAP2 family protein [Alphaproteobacteria bacterium]
MGIADWRAFMRRELAAVLGVAVPLLAYVCLAAFVTDGGTRPFDEAIARAMHSPGHDDPIGPPWLESRIFEVTSLGSIMVVSLATLSATGLLLVLRKYGAALLLLIAVGGGAGLSESSKIGLAHSISPLADESGMSFPSGHATLAAVCYFTIAALLAREQENRQVRTYILVIAVIATLLVGVSRVYLGVHRATDVLGGWCLGAAWAIFCWNVAYWLERRGYAAQNA